MLYLANASSPTVRQAMRDGRIGMLSTPAEGRSPADYPVWAADNGAFGKGYPGDAELLAWLRKHQAHADRCLFATAPDVVGDAVATLERSRPFFAPIRALGYPAGFVAQDGIEHTTIPWDEFDVLFIGGSTEFKLGVVAAQLCVEAKGRGKGVHVGRVNSAKRWRRFQALGCVDSCDGTFLAFGPDVNLKRQATWNAAAIQGAMI